MVAAGDTTGCDIGAYPPARRTRGTAIPLDIPACPP